MQNKSIEIKFPLNKKEAEALGKRIKKAACSGLALDATGPSKTNGTNVVTWTNGGMAKTRHWSLPRWGEGATKW